MSGKREPMQLYTISQLEDVSGVPRRTIYFYVKEGLLPSPGGRGPSARYTELHRLRLALIELLKKSTHLRLQGIKEYIEPLSLDEMRREIRELGGGTAPAPTPDAGARDPQRPRKTGGPARVDDEHAAVMSCLDWDGSPDPPADEELRVTASGGEVPDFASLAARRRMAGIDRHDSVRATEDGGGTTVGGDVWHRVNITEDIEIHVRGFAGPRGEARASLEQRINELIYRARKIFR